MNFHLVESLVTVAHMGQRRDDGEDYVNHPFRVRNLLVRFGLHDENLHAAALCHDLFEDTTATEAELLAATNLQVLRTVKHLTNKTVGNFAVRSNALLEHAKHFNDVSKMVKMADRHDNVSTALLTWEPKRVKRYASVGLSLLDAMGSVPPEAEALRNECHRLFSCVA